MQPYHARFQGSDEASGFHRVTSIVTACYFAVYFQAGPAFSEDTAGKAPRLTATLAPQAESEKTAGTILFSQACAKRDVELVIEIEIRGDDRAADANETADAMSKLLDARAACSQGRTKEALAMYDDVSHVLLRSPPLANR
jgi:hypothetical protein